MKNLQNNNQNQLELLKQLLLEDELKQLKQLASKLSSLEIDFNNDEVIEEKVKPVFDDVLLSNLSQKDSKTIEILASYLASVITTSTNQDIDKLSHALQAVISPAISNEIENNKDKMIDALYPIMGGMISKYVTQSIKEMMESINQKIEEGLSFDRYKRKIKAKLTGVSEVELLLEESSDATIESILVIHKETGLMIAEAHQENKELDDAVMVASMASAIKDFVNDWIQNQGEEMASEVQILSYGNATLYIESAGSVYMIAFMDAEPDYEQRKEINQFFAKVLSKYSKLFHSFDGDTTNEQIPKLEEKLYSFLQQQKTSVSKKDTNSSHPNIAKYLLYTLLLVSVGYMAYQGYDRYKLSVVEKEVLKKVDTPIKLIHTDNGIELYGYVDSILEYNQIEDILKEHNYNHIYNYLHIPASHTSHKIKDLQTKIAQINSELNNTKQTISAIKDVESMMKTLQEDNKKLSSNIVYLTQQLKKLSDRDKKRAYIRDIKKHILNDLAKRFKHNRYYHVEDGSLDFAITNLFLPAQSIPNPKKLDQVSKDYESYITTIFSDDIRKKVIKHLIIEGYTDSSGNAQKNLILSAQRAKHIKEYLQGLDISKKMGISSILISKGMGAKNPVIVNGVEDKNASRRIKIRFELDNDKILSMIKE
jgi:flagellar motor protein MotB